MYQSKRSITNKDLFSLKNDLDDFLQRHEYITAKSFKNRKVFLSKLPEVIVGRKSSAKKRLSCFLVAMDILKHSKRYKIYSKNENEVTIQGLGNDGRIVEIHLREELDKKNKKLFFISCFPKKKLPPAS